MVSRVERFETADKAVGEGRRKSSTGYGLWSEIVSCDTILGLLRCVALSLAGKFGEARLDTPPSRTERRKKT